MSQPTPPPYDSSSGGASPLGPDTGNDQQPPYGQQQSPYGQQQPAYGSQPPSYGSQSHDQYGGYGGYAGGSAPSNNTMAMISLVAGIVGLTVLPFLGSIVAVITGHMARREIARTGEQGSGLATAGLIMGWIGVGILVLIVVLALVVFGSMAAMVGSAGAL